MFSDCITPFLYFKNELDNFVLREGSHPMWTIIILTSGSFEVTMQKKKETAEKYDIIVFPADMEFERNVLEHISYYCIQFEIDHKLLTNFDIPFGKHNFSDKKRLKDNLDLLDKYLTLHSPVSENIKLHILMDILFQIYINNSSFEPEFLDKNTEGIVKYIQKHYTEDISLNNLANNLFITPSGLIFKFKKAMGITPVEYIINLRIELAKNLLSTTDVKIYDIAEQCGYKNVYYFSNAFKKITGMSPSTFRTTTKNL